MIEEYILKVKKNNETILDLKNKLKKYFNKEFSNNDYSFSSETSLDQLKLIYENQIKEINTLHMIIDGEYNNMKLKNFNKVEELKKLEKDKNFSDFYRNGVIEIYGNDIKVEKFYIKKIEKDNQTIINFICVDKRIDKNLFGTIDDKDYNIKNVFPFRNSKIFYQIYLDKKIFINNKIIINNSEQLAIFRDYIHNWTSEMHYMVAETMIYKEKNN